MKKSEPQITKSNTEVRGPGFTYDLLLFRLQAKSVRKSVERKKNENKLKNAVRNTVKIK